MISFSRQPVRISSRTAAIADGISRPSASISSSTWPTRRSSAALRNRSRFSSRYFLMCLRGFEPSGRTPQLGEIEHLGEDLQAAVGLVGNVPVLVMEAGNLLAADLGDRPPAEEGEDELLEASPVLLLRRGLQVHGDVLGVEPGGEVLHCHRVAADVALGQRIDALAQGGEVLDGASRAPAPASQR